jgi:hypothetical protein
MILEVRRHHYRAAAVRIADVNIGTIGDEFLDLRDIAFYRRGEQTSVGCDFVFAGGDLRKRRA